MQLMCYVIIDESVRLIANNSFSMLRNVRAEMS